MFYKEDDNFYLEKSDSNSTIDENGSDIKLNSDERYTHFNNGGYINHGFNNWGHSNFAPPIRPFYPNNNSIPQNIFPCGNGKYNYGNGQECYFNASGYPFIGMANNSMPKLFNLSPIVSTPIVTKRASELFD